MVDEVRYAHTIALKEIGVSGQEKLKNSKVAVIGAGGLASSALLLLSSMGVGSITIIDNDVVSLTNLPRQILYSDSDIGNSKVEVAKKKLELLNPNVHICALNERLEASNAIELLKGHDVILDCTDNFETKFLIDDTCKELNIPFVIAGVSDYQGQVCTCIPMKSQDFKSLFSTLPINIEEKYKLDDFGVYPIAVNTISNIAANEVVKLLVGFGDLLLDQMLVYNLKTNHFNIIKFPQ